MRMTLSATGLADLVLTDAPFYVTTYDPGAPAPREVVESAPDADGEIDTTAYEGARTVTLGMQLNEWTQETVQALKAFTHPRVRTTLTAEFDGSPARRAVGRLLPFGDPFGDEDFQADRRLFVIQLRCPTGIFESAELHTETIIPGAGTTDGLEFDGIEFDGVEFPLVDPPGTIEVVNAGDRDAYPILRLFGPFGDDTDPADEVEVANVTAGRSLVFAQLEIAADDYLEIDFRRKTILVNGVASQSRYGLLQFPDSSWWTLTPGTNEVAFRPDTFSGNAQALVIWRDAYS